MGNDAHKQIQFSITHMFKNSVAQFLKISFDFVKIVRFHGSTPCDRRQGSTKTT